MAEALAEPETPAESVDAAPAEAPMEPAAAETVAETSSEPAAAGDAAPAEAAAADAGPADAPETPAAPELVEVWRPGGRSEERRPRHDRSRHRHHERPAEGISPAAAGEAGEAAKGERHRRGRRDRHHEFRKPRPDASAEGVVAAAPDGAPAPAREPRDDNRGRPPRFEGKGGREDRNKGKFRGDREHGGRDKGGRDRDKGGRENGPSHRQYATSASPRERDRPVDPNSPFAKLAALKEQLAANRKD